MRVLIDGIVFENDYQRGVQRYFRELLARSVKSFEVDFFLSQPAKTELPGIPVTYRKERFGAHPANIPLRSWRKMIRCFAPTRFTGHALFHSTFFTRSPEPGIPEVVTVYDLIPERFEAQYHKWGQAHIDNKRRCMEAAKKIICISHATAADIADLYPHLADRLAPIHLGADHLTNQPDMAHAARAQPDRTKPYLLQVGDRHAYKNFPALVKAMAEPAWPTELQLRVAGNPPSSEEIADIARLNLQSKVTFEGVVPDKALHDLYRDSTGFAFPSLAEGFGFPLLEAQSLGAPVICSDIPVFHETAGDSAMFFDGKDPASIASAAGKLLNNDSSSLRAAGFANVRRFRWDQCASLTADVYRSAAGDT